MNGDTNRPRLNSCNPALSGCLWVLDPGDGSSREDERERVARAGLPPVDFVRRVMVQPVVRQVSVNLRGRRLDGAAVGL